MSYSNNPRDWSDERIVAFLKNYWKCDNFIFLSTIVKEPYKTKNPEKYKGSIRDLICGGKVLSYPNTIPPIFFNISATTKHKFFTGQYFIEYELEDRDRREYTGNMFMLRPV